VLCIAEKLNLTFPGLFDSSAYLQAESDVHGETSAPIGLVEAAGREAVACR
jgi:hypothetical protein